MVCIGIRCETMADHHVISACRYRLWMEGECVRVTFTFVKELYIDLSEQTPHVDLSPVQVPTPLSQVQVNPDTITSNADSNKHVTELL